MSQLGALALFTEDFHDKLKTPLIISLIICIPFLLGLVFFSAGAGRLVSPGIVLLLVSGPPALVALAISKAARDSTTQVGRLAGGEERARGLVSDALPKFIDVFMNTYRLAALTGFLLLVLAAMIKIARHFARRQAKPVPAS